MGLAAGPSLDQKPVVFSPKVKPVGGEGPQNDVITDGQRFARSCLCAGTPSWRGPCVVARCWEGGPPGGSTEGPCLVHLSHLAAPKSHHLE